ncbi:MAG: EAL domain-containing protein, partial [Leptospiraceae bacterium]|nr:EAL domain-containing protein [Leptospiraceae bacterium]
MPELIMDLKGRLEEPVALGTDLFSLKTLICATPLSLARTELDPLEKIIMWSSAHFSTMRKDPAVEWAILEAIPETNSNAFRLEQRLREAMDQDEFLLHFQPIISQTLDSVVGCEALIRWQDPRSDHLVMPMTFMPVAEQSELIHRLGLWITARVARQARSMQEAGLNLEFYSLNAAVPQLMHGSFSRETLRIWREFGLPPSLLKVEITESVMAEHRPVMAENLRHLRD